jgi:hypothetical protein
VRFHKAKKVSQAEANFIIKTPTSSLNDNVVISQHDAWYDVRMMTRRELEEFVCDLERSELASFRAGVSTPH